MSLFGAVGNVAGGLIGAYNSNKVQEANYNAQKEFAQNGIRWRVDDAKAAGIHPLFALGANTSQYTPVSGYGGDYGIGGALESMGQSIDRAKAAKQTAAERAINEIRQEKLFDLDVRQKEANIALTQAEISATQRRNQQQVPPMPKVGKNGLIDGQAQALRSPGTEKDINKIGQWVEMPNGAFIYMPSADYLDYFSENPTKDGVFQLGAMEAYRKGSLRPPRKAKSGYEWKMTNSGLKEVKKKAPGKPLYAMDLYELMDYFGWK